MALNDKSDTTDQAKRTAGAGPYPGPHQNGPGTSALNPFHLAIAELQADTDEPVPEPQPAPAPQAPPAPGTRQTIVLTQPVRALHIGNWIAIGALAIGSGLLGGLIVAGASSGKSQRSAEPVPATDPAVAQDLEALKTRTGELLKQIDRLQQKLAALPPPTPPTDLSGVEQKLVALSRETDGLTKTAKRVGDLESSASALSESVGGLRGDAKNLRIKLDTLERTIKTLAERPPVAAPAPGRDDKTSTAPSIAQGAELFRRGKYKDALGVFNKLEVINPEDARVWYFAALSHGLATNLWSGGTAELVAKGIERERAGTPAAAEIDAAFRDLTVGTGRDWLDEYRKRAR